MILKACESKEDCFATNNGRVILRLKLILSNSHKSSKMVPFFHVTSLEWGFIVPGSFATDLSVQDILNCDPRDNSCKGGFDGDLGEVRYILYTI